MILHICIIGTSDKYLRHGRITVWTARTFRNTRLTAKDLTNGMVCFYIDRVGK